MTPTTTHAHSPRTDASNSSSSSTCRAVALPIRFQCPLCFDVLRRPVLLPCCKLHLCTECFERALELTSVNCGFCRKRIVGFARKKQNKVDNKLWNEILAKCPFLGGSLINSSGPPAEASWTVEFVDEQAAPRQALQTQSQELKPGELKQIYEQRVREYQSQIEEAEARALEKTMDFLQSDAEYLASVAQHDHQSTPVVSLSASLSSQTVIAKKPLKPHGITPPHSDRASASSVQQRLDLFFASSTESLDSFASSSELQSPSTHRSKLVKLDGKYVSSTAQHRDSQHSPRRRKPTVIQTTLLQLSASTASAQNRISTTPRSSISTPSEKRDSLKVTKPKLTEKPNRRTPWQCVQCTFENTCFDRVCSMCHAALPPLLS